MPARQINSWDLKRKDVLDGMKKRVIITVVLLLLGLFIVSIPALAHEYNFTATSFRYVGDFFHHKEIDMFGGDEGEFHVQGFGEVRGSHDVHAVDYKDGGRKSNITMDFSGTTDPNYAAGVMRLREEMLAHLEAQRQQAVAALNEEYKASPAMTAEEYAARLRSIHNDYDNRRRQAIDSYNDAQKNVRIISSVEISDDALVRVGVSMNPGETGSIKKDVAHTNHPDGEYLRISNRFSNTGGTTKREINVDGFFEERMRVDGYAEVWERTTKQKGDARTGWYDTRP